MFCLSLALPVVAFHGPSRVDSRAQEPPIACQLRRLYSIDYTMESASRFSVQSRRERDGVHLPGSRWTGVLPGGLRKSGGPCRGNFEPRLSLFCPGVAHEDERTIGTNPGPGRPCGISAPCRHHLRMLVPASARGLHRVLSRAALQRARDPDGPRIMTCISTATAIETSCFSESSLRHPDFLSWTWLVNS